VLGGISGTGRVTHVQAVTAGSPAATNGLRPGDVISRELTRFTCYCW
jgi:S1-C subfamily serine protease